MDYLFDTIYLLDTNVVSELARLTRMRNVVAWVRAGDKTCFYLGVLSFGEIRRGIERLPQGPRRERLRLWLEVDLMDRFTGRILDIDRQIAEIRGHDHGARGGSLC
jgi:predicted nucleic acid-binding protein